MIEINRYIPYLLKRRNNPALLIPVCLGPSISFKVPLGRDDPTLGINVTLVRSPNFLVMEIPWVAFLPSSHPSLRRTLINCLPVMAGSLVNLGSYQLPKRLYIRLVEVILVYRHTNINVPCRSMLMNRNILFPKKALSFSNIFKCIQVEYNSLPKSFLSLRKGTAKSRSAQLITNSNPSSIFLTESSLKDYISLSHFLSFLSFILLSSKIVLLNIHHVNIYSSFNSCLNSSKSKLMTANSISYIIFTFQGNILPLEIYGLFYLFFKRYTAEIIDRLTNGETTKIE